MKTIKPKGSGQIFQNRFLELLTKTHPAVIYGMYIPLCSYSIYYHFSNFSHNLWASVGITLLGMLTWTLAEYLLHRFVFHYIDETRLAQKFHYAVHGVHHEYPNDRGRTLMPPVPSLIFSGVFFLIFWLIMGNAVFAFLPGFVFGYLSYAAIHYSIHAFQPPFNFLKPLWMHHHVHHHKHPERAFGVSSRFWDYIFRTMPPSLKKR